MVRLRPRLPVLMVASALLALACGGCSYRLEAWSGKDDKTDVTGSTPLLRTPVHTAAPALPRDGDLALAKAAARDVLNGGNADASQPWENPQTGARGTVTPIATAYNQDGQTCRDFLASYVREGAESWLQGEACRAQQGKWEVKTLRPWKRI